MQQERAGASERAVQMYCDVHRLFLRMSEDHPVIKNMALNHVKEFIRDPETRTRKGTPDLGLLITYLSILDEVSWSDLCSTFVPEMIRRAFGRMKEPLHADRCQSNVDVIAKFDALEPEHGRVILFFKVFNSLVARPSSPWHEPLEKLSGPAASGALSVADVRDMYDRRWGQLPMDRCKAVLSEINRMCGISSVATVLRELLPFDFSQDNVCELILWADKHGQNKKAIQEWPDLRKMTTRLTLEWQTKRDMQIAFKKQAQTLLGRVHDAKLPSSDCLGQLMSMTRSFWESNGKESKAPPKHRFGSAEEACALAAHCRDRAAERLSAKGKGKGKGKTAAVSDSDSDSDASVKCDFEVLTEDMGKATSTPSESIQLKVRIGQEMSGEVEQSFDLQVDYTGSEDGVSGSRLRSLIAAETQLDVRKMRLLLRNATDCKDRVLSAKATVARAELAAPGVLVEVGKKQRGGRKPGNGWHAIRSVGRTYQMSIAGAIARETVFSKVEQYFTIVEGGDVLDCVIRLCNVLAKDATVICGGGHQVFKQQAIDRGWEVSEDTVNSTMRVAHGSCKLLLLSEVDAVEPKSSTSFYEVEEPDLPVPMPERVQGVPPAKGSGKGGKGSGSMGGSKDELPVPATVNVPVEVAQTGVIVVLDGHLLRETASLSQIIYEMHRANSKNDKPTPLFHLATEVRHVLVETAEHLQSISGSLSTEGRANTAIELPSQPSVPSGAILMQNEVTTNSSLSLPCVSQLPCVLSFRLRLPSLGLVTRIRDRFGCSVYEIFYDVLRTLLDENESES
jgi:hypothetical protein